jgi:uncharacterized membrane protein required for colicin V production
LVRKIIGLLGLILAIGLAFEFSEPVGEFFAPVFNNDQYLAEIVCGILIFLLAMFIVFILKRIIHPLDKVNRFINQFLGGISGVIQMIFFISGFLLFLNIFNVPNKADRDSSLVYGKVYQLIPNTIDFLLGKDSKAKVFIKNYIESKDVDTLFQDLDSLDNNQ